MSNIGFRVFYKVNRADREIVESFKNLPVANIADSVSRFFVAGDGVRPFNEVPLVGSAITVKARISDNLMFHKAIEMAQEGDVIVVDAGGDCVNALAGEIMMSYAKKKGIRGFVINGAVRDVEAVKKCTDFSVYAKGVTPKGPYKDGPGEINVPISIGGVVVCPGDIIVGDADGIVVVSPNEAVEVQKKAKAKLDSEVEKFKAINQGTMDKSWVDERLEELGCEHIYD